MSLSKDQRIKNAIKDINAMDTVDQVRAYIAGDERPDVINSANVQIEFLEGQASSSEKPLPTEGEDKGEGAASHADKVSDGSEGAADAPKEPAIHPTDPKDTTSEWIGKFENLQPKQGEVSSITQKPEAAGIKGVIQKDHRNKVLTIRNGVPTWVYYDEKGDELRAEAVPGHGTPLVTKEVEKT